MDISSDFEVIEEDSSEISPEPFAKTRPSLSQKSKKGAKMTVVFDNDHKAKLKALAFVDRTTVREVLRQALKQYFISRGEELVDKAVEIHERFIQE